MEGQLLPAERKLLYDCVLAAKPKTVLEVGTWRGGGSTMQIVNALEKLGAGMLYTCEPDELCHDIAKAGWAGNKFIQLFKATSDALIKIMVKVPCLPEFIFFDGPEDPAVALRDIKTLEPHLTSGTIFMMHDWDPPSKKATDIRPYLETSPLWEGVIRLTAPISVGICCYKKK